MLFILFAIILSIENLIVDVERHIKPEKQKSEKKQTNKTMGMSSNSEFDDIYSLRTKTNHLEKMCIEVAIRCASLGFFIENDRKQNRFYIWRLMKNDA